MVSPIVPTPAPVEVYTVKTRGEEALSAKELVTSQGRIEKIFGGFMTGSAQKLASASKKLLKDPASEATSRAFYTAFKARCTKLGIDTAKLVPGEERQLIEQVLSENGKEVTNLSDVQKSVVEKLVTIAKNTFVDTLSDSMLVGDVKSAIEKKAEELAAFSGNGATAKAFETDLKSVVFAKFGKALKEQAEFKGQVAERLEAETKKLGDMRKEYRNFRSSEFSSQMSHDRLVYDAMKSKIAKSAEFLVISVVMLNKDLSGLQKALTKLVETGKSKGVNCESQEELLELVTRLTQDFVTERSVESMKEVGDQLPALLKFLNAGDGRFSSGPVTKNLPAEKVAVKAAISALEKSLAQFTSANQDLATAKSDKDQLIATTDAVEDTNDKLEAELNDQKTLLLDQAALDAYEVAMSAHNAVVAGLRFYNSIPEAPKAPETTTGGVAAIVEKEAAAIRAPAQALYDYLKPVEVVAKKPSLLNRLTLGYIG